MRPPRPGSGAKLRGTVGHEEKREELLLEERVAAAVELELARAKLRLSSGGTSNNSKTEPERETVPGKTGGIRIILR